MSNSLVRSMALVLSTGLIADRPALAQFGNGGFLSDLLNQALPRVTQPNNPSGFPNYPSQNVPPGFPTTLPSTNPQWGSGSITGRPQDWTLGVALDNLDTGAIVRQVNPGSPAQRAGLEPNDIIIAIGGVQVGLVEGRLNDVGEQLRRSADPNGRVRALVLDGRSSRLQNIDISLESASTAIAGVATIRGSANLPYGSLLRVKTRKCDASFLRSSRRRRHDPDRRTWSVPVPIEYRSDLYRAPRPISVECANHERHRASSIYHATSRSGSSRWPGEQCPIGSGKPSGFTNQWHRERYSSFVSHRSQCFESNIPATPWPTPFEQGTGRLVVVPCPRKFA